MDRSFYLIFIISFQLPSAWAAMDSCYDEEGNPSRCLPEFKNIAFNRTVTASNVCGSPPEDYCMQTGSTRSCHTCDTSDPALSHNASLLTDWNDDPTWWQSQSMFYGIQHPNSVNLTLHLGKAFVITYIRLKFYTSRPESFAIYKRTKEDGPWIPYQYYSGSCEKTYDKAARGYIRPGEDERTALCTDEFSDISPLTGGNVAFSTLEGRPSAYNFDHSAVLQDWVTATDLLISLDRLNTFGDEFFKDAKVLRSYFYAISDFSVGGRCKCNGHASECVQGESGDLVCACQHHTEGVDCQRCQPFYQDRPWARATGDSANQCLKCDCSGRSDECVFDMDQYRGTGSGGRCLNCRDNTDGPHCERCKEDHYRSSPEDVCLPCNCNINGSVTQQCDQTGSCVCKEGVTGEKCDTCTPGFHSLGLGGCRPCGCSPVGSVGHCSAVDGHCSCKANVEGQNCDRCKPGSFDLQQMNPGGCQACFCFGHSLACSSSSHYRALNITSDFTEDQDGWVGLFSGGQEYPLQWKEGEVYLLPLSQEDTGFYKAPEKFLGSHIHSYGQPLVITFTSETPELLPERVTLILEGSGLTLTADLSPHPTVDLLPGLAPRSSFTVRLHEHETRFIPSLSSFNFQLLLNNLTVFKISNAGGHNYTAQLAGVILTSAFISTGAESPPAPWVEFCSCPVGFMGQFCEQCSPGFTREQPGRGPLSACVPCNCHHHGTCHPETGVCDCTDFTTGLTCELCLDGYYGNALIGTPGDCHPCPCPDHTSCAQIAGTGQVVCTNCPAGQTGTRCQMCEDGYYGDPLGQSGHVRPCVRCECNDNVDVNALGTCDHITGRCLKCLGHTEGDHCERCQPGFYGDALNQTVFEKCKPCRCNPGGTFGLANECHPQTGDCLCLSHVTGRDCSSCEVGFFNLQPGLGCERCKCNPIGSSSSACHPVMGQCVCRAGVEGRLCETCRPGFFGFSSRGCRACNCDPMGSVSMQCHSNGTCHCRPGFVGYKCDKCEMNYFHNKVTHQCEECPVCYGLIKKQAEKLQTQLQDLEKLLAQFDCRGRSGKQPHLLKYHRSRLYGHEHQGEDTLPNALEDFLAFQEAREAFIKQFASLEASAGMLSAQLHGVTATLNCTDARGLTQRGEEGWKEMRESEGIRTALCQTFTSTGVMIAASQRRLKQATLDMDDMVFPFEMPSLPNKWNVMVNDSHELMKSHKDAADHVEAIASSALQASNRTFVLLMDLLMDSSTEEYIRNLTEQITGMQQWKEDLEVQVNETAAAQTAVEEEAERWNAALGNLTSSLHQLGPASVNTSAESGQASLKQILQSNRTTALDLEKRVKALDFRVETADSHISEIRTKMEPQTQAANEKLDTGDKVDQSIYELQARVQEAKITALSSVVSGKEVESEAIALRRGLEYTVKEWPRQQLQTKAVLKKERPLREKVLAEVKRKVAQVEEMLQPALKNSSDAANSSATAEQIAQSVAKESKNLLSQAKHTRTASAHLSSHIDSVMRRLTEQELLSRKNDSQLFTEPEVSLKKVKEDMKLAEIQLKAYSATLTELISKIDGSIPLERFDRILNSTAQRLHMLRGSVDNPALTLKIHKLKSAATEQQTHLSLIEQDIHEITVERDSLRDIALTLPQSCAQISEPGKV
ncbi:laminin subunit gamma-3 [Periophthalmus magnuspinnatus]|uniref:laminin subunit gamma-3 n=1 Tax=Periophthalmus magnuspinnatus TaxID=409849 RepID=UPI00145A07E7|nr:laminin subunit gamma-3 [Periophthalmus magnuspinnatus]